MGGDLANVVATTRCAPRSMAISSGIEWRRAEGSPQAGEGTEAANRFRDLGPRRVRWALPLRRTSVSQLTN